MQSHIKNSDFTITYQNLDISMRENNSSYTLFNVAIKYCWLTFHLYKNRYKRRKEIKEPKINLAMYTLYTVYKREKKNLVSMTTM